jgi:hypothetical protein
MIFLQNLYHLVPTSHQKVSTVSEVANTLRTGGQAKQLGQVRQVLRGLEQQEHKQLGQVRQVLQGL